MRCSLCYEHEKEKISPYGQRLWYVANAFLDFPSTIAISRMV